MMQCTGRSGNRLARKTSPRRSRRGAATASPTGAPPPHPFVCARLVAEPSVARRAARGDDGQMQREEPPHCRPRRSRWWANEPRSRSSPPARAGRVVAQSAGRSLLILNLLPGCSVPGCGSVSELLGPSECKAALPRNLLDSRRKGPDVKRASLHCPPSRTRRERTHTKKRAAVTAARFVRGWHARRGRE